MSEHTPFHILNLIRVNTVQHKKAAKDIDRLWKDFGVAIRQQRKAKKVKLAVFAQALGYTTAMITYMERGDRHWPIAKAQKAVSLLSRGDRWPD